jgi:hypothetical protein
MNKLKLGLIAVFYILAVIGTLDMSAHAVGGFCINPLNLIVRHYYPNGLLHGRL